MFGISEKIRWVLLSLGGAIVLLGFLDHKEMLNDYPTLSFITFPYIWVLGFIIIFIGYGLSEENSKPIASDSGDCAPGLGERKNGPFGDGPSSGDGGGSAGGD